MLEMRPGCERCDVDLPPEEPGARVCSFECTFCTSCAEGPLAGSCPNCGGGFAPRPTRRAGLLGQFPAAAARTFNPPTPT